MGGLFVVCCFALQPTPASSCTCINADGTHGLRFTCASKLANPLHEMFQAMRAFAHMPPKALKVRYKS